MPSPFRNTLQAEKRREDAAQLPSDVALPSSGLWQAAAAAAAAVAAYLAWPSDLGEPEFTAPDAPRWLFLGPSP